MESNIKHMETAVVRSLKTTIEDTLVGNSLKVAKYPSEKAKGCKKTPYGHMIGKSSGKGGI